MLVAIIAGVVLIGTLIVLLLVWLSRQPEPVSIPEARAAFEAQRVNLEPMFFTAASATGKPRGLRWKSCEFGADFELARDRCSGEILAFVPVTIAFEAIPGSDMEGLPAVGNLRSASAVFTWRTRRWVTAGRAVFNLSPAEAIRHFHQQYEPVSADGSSPSADERKKV